LSAVAIKAATLLIDQTNMQIQQGKQAHNTVINAGISRLRPVSMVALMTVLGIGRTGPFAPR